MMPSIPNLENTQLNSIYVTSSTTFIPILICFLSVSTAFFINNIISLLENKSSYFDHLWIDVY